MHYFLIAQNFLPSIHWKEIFQWKTFGMYRSSAKTEEIKSTPKTNLSVFWGLFHRIL